MRAKRTTTVFRRIFLPLFLIAAIQALLLYGILFVNGVFVQFDQNALNTLQERTQNQYQNIRTHMINEWSNLLSTEEAIGTLVSNALIHQGKTWNDIQSDAALNASLIEDCSEELIYRLRSNKTTGIFMILDGVGVAGDPASYAGVYIRDTDPSSETSDDSDLHMVRGLPPLSRLLGLTLDSFWKAGFSFEGGAEDARNAYFYNPLREAQKGTSIKSQYYAYWSPVFQINPEGATPAITYSIPLINQNGYVYGVLGVELSQSYLQSVLSSGESTDSRNGFYYLGITRDGGKTYEKIATSGVRY